MEEGKRTERSRNHPDISAEQPERDVEEQSIAVSIYVARCILHVSVQSSFASRSVPSDLMCRLANTHAVGGSKA